MNRSEYLLTCLVEECSEIIKVCCKAQRFGLNHTNWNTPGGPDNKGNLILELNDLIAGIQLLEDDGILPLGWLQPPLVNAKKRKVLDRMEAPDAT